MNAIERLRDLTDWVGTAEPERTERESALAAVDDLYQAAEAWAYERRRWIDGEAPDRAAMQDAEAGLVVAVRRIEEGA